MEYVTKDVRQKLKWRSIIYDTRIKTVHVPCFLLYGLYVLCKRLALKNI